MQLIVVSAYTPCPAEICSPFFPLFSPLCCADDMSFSVFCEHNVRQQPKNKITVMDQTDPSLVPDDTVVVAVAGDDDVVLHTTVTCTYTGTHL